MTSTSTPRSATRDPLSDLLGTAVPTDSEELGDTTPRRRRSRFPAADVPASPQPAGERPRARWAGADGALRELVRDHATAVGLELAEGPGAGPAVCLVAEAGALDPAPGAHGAPDPPLLVVTDSPEIPSSLWRRALAAGARAVIPLPAGSEELLAHLAELARPRTSSLVLGVVGGCGGAGASSFAARLAAAARARGPVTLVDADPLGGGLDLLIEAAPEGVSAGPGGLGWSEVARLGPDDGEALRAGLPQVDEVRLLIAGMGEGPSAGALSAALVALAPLGGTVVVDLAAGMVPSALDHLDRLLVVVPATDHAVRAAARRLRDWSPPPGLAEAVVRRRGPLTAREVGEDLALPLAAGFRDSSRGAVPLLDVRRGGADRAARDLLRGLVTGSGS
ncbi:hypothetical protein ACT3SP_10990 [Brachybacterium sp. AOP43-C2-M15]|uniref:hypothetical protein n=1 Tax=Brachybacterium sp. AOP43-C2-M15 TaxID=3457661 RepID=UPI004034689C